jgi:hypothetical protein
MCDYRAKYLKYKKKYMSSKQHQTGGDIMFVRSPPSDYNLIDKRIVNNEFMYNTIAQSSHSLHPTSFTTSEKDTIELFINLILPNLIINGNKNPLDISCISSYLSHGTYGATFDLGNSILKIIKTPIINEIKYMLELDNVVPNLCHTYCFASVNELLMIKTVSSGKYFNGIFKVYCSTGSSIEEKSINAFTMLNAPRIDSSSQLCFMIIEKGFSDTYNFNKKLSVSKNLTEMFKVINITTEQFVAKNIKILSTDLIKLLYACKFAHNIFSSLHILNVNQRLLHCDLRLDNTIMIKERDKLLPLFKIIDLGLITKIVPLKLHDDPTFDVKLYTNSPSSAPPAYFGIGLYLDDGHYVYCTELLDLYCLFIMISQLLGIIVYAPATIGVGHVINVYCMYDKQMKTLTPLYKFTTQQSIVSVVLEHLEKLSVMCDATGDIPICIGLFQILVVLSQIPLLLTKVTPPKKRHLLTIKIHDRDLRDETIEMPDIGTMYDLIEEYSRSLIPVLSI